MFFHSPPFSMARHRIFNLYEFLVWIFLTQIDKGYWSNKLCNQVLADFDSASVPATFTLLSSEDKTLFDPRAGEDLYIYIFLPP